MALTKVEAIRKLLIANSGVAVWGYIYDQIEKYYPKAKQPIEWQAALRGTLYREIKNGRSFKMIAPAIVGLIDYDERQQVLNEDRSLLTERSVQAVIRVGQDRFRKKLLSAQKYCPITLINDHRILNAGHIKPWAVSSDSERLDVNNGFLFSPSIDKLFDYGLISFENDKRIIISKSISEKNLKNLGLERNKVYDKLPVLYSEKYLDYHRNYIYGKKFKMADTLI